jgi:hypothetical protein
LKVDGFEDLITNELLLRVWLIIGVDNFSSIEDAFSCQFSQVNFGLAQIMGITICD